MRKSHKWRVCRIQITHRDKTRSVVDCVRKGALAVHRTLKGDGKNLYAVTHVPSGLLITITIKEEDAKKIVDHVVNQIPNHYLDTGYPEYVLQHIPAEMIHWLRQCRKQHCYLTPEGKGGEIVYAS